MSKPSPLRSISMRSPVKFEITSKTCGDELRRCLATMSERFRARGAAEVRGRRSLHKLISVGAVEIGVDPKLGGSEAVRVDLV
jgi:hypothetical protein